MNLKPNKHKISFNTTMTSLGFIIVGTPPLLNGGYDLPKIESVDGVQNFLLERGDKPVKGG